MSLMLPVDPVEYRGASNGSFTASVFANTDAIAPGSFVAIGLTGQLADGRMTFVCNLIPDIAQLWLKTPDTPDRFIRLSALPSGFSSTAPRGCEPLVAQIPADAPLGKFTFSFVYRGGPNLIEASTEVSIVPSRVSIFTPPSRLTQPLRPGEFAEIQVNGLGVAPPEDITMLVAGEATEISRMDRNVGPAGFSSVRFRIPLQTPEGCYVPVYLRVRGLGETQAIYLPISSQDGPCRHPFGLGESALRDLDQGRRIWIGQPSIDLFLSENTAQATARFQLANADRVAFLSSPQETRACRLRLSGTPVVTAAFTEMTSGDAGEKLTLQPPEESPQQMTARNRLYLAQFPIPSNPVGTWKFTVPGGEQVAAFETSIDLPSPPNWTPPERVSRDTDLQIDVAMDSPNPNDTVTVILQPRLSSTFLECRADTQSGQITLPARYLRTFPPGVDGFIGLVVTRTANRTVFPMPLATGETGTGVFDYRLLSVSDIRIE